MEDTMTMTEAELMYDGRIPSHILSSIRERERMNKLPFKERIAKDILFHTKKFHENWINFFRTKNEECLELMDYHQNKIKQLKETLGE